MSTPPTSAAAFTRRSPLARAACASMLGVVALLAGCAQKQIGDLPIYPDDRKQGRVLDVQVIRDETEISMTNTAAQDLPPGRLWINAWYSREFPGLPIGHTATFNLFDFKDRYGDAFRAGGFFATKKPDRMVQAQIEAGDELIGLIAIRASRD